MCVSSLEPFGAGVILRIDCTSCPKGPSLEDPKCLSFVLSVLEKCDPRYLVLHKDYRQVYGSQAVRSLKELSFARMRAIEALSSLKSAAGLPDGFLPELKHAFGSDLMNAIKLIDSVPKAKKGTQLNLIRMLVGSASAFGGLSSGGLRPDTVPGFISSFIEKEQPARSRVLEEYSTKGGLVKILNVPSRVEPLYFLIPSELSLAPKQASAVSSAISAIASGVGDLSMTDPKSVRANFNELARAALLKEGVLGSELDSLAEIVVRYTAGFGLIENVFADTHLQDIYLDSSGERVHAFHDVFEDCTLNLSLSGADLERISSRLRAGSGRPFDEAFPVLDSEVREFGLRVCGVRHPATYSGTGFAFRRHNPHPWSLPMFIGNGMLTAEAAGLLSFLVDGQSSILVTGPRASGKTSLLSALVCEILPNFRIIAIEDTPELPVDSMRASGFKIEHLRTRPALVDESYELSTVQILRAALRLGESVLVLGEVRGPEAKALFEAMRIGASGNAVLGTIHGSSAYDTWDRIVNDLGVPSTSFKAADVVLSCASLRKGDDIKRRRRLVDVSEVCKHWTADPHKEGGFRSLMSYSQGSDSLSLSLSLNDSELIARLAASKGMSVPEALENIQARAKVKQAFVDAARKYSFPDALSVSFVARGNCRYLELSREGGDVFGRWQGWLEMEVKHVSGK